MSQVKEKYGSGADLDDLDSEEDSDEDSTEDEDGEQLTPAVDAAIFRTLAKIKQKDPEIYEVGKSIFESELYAKSLFYKLSINFSFQRRDSKCKIFECGPLQLVKTMYAPLLLQILRSKGT